MNNYRGWKYNPHFNERANLPFDSHMHINYCIYKYLKKYGLFTILKIRKSSSLKLKRRFKFKKNMDW